MPFECNHLHAVILFWVVEVDEITIYLLAESMATIVLHYGLPRSAKLARKLKWLIAGCHIQVKRIMFRSYDSHNNIYVCCRSDHTTIDVILKSTAFVCLDIPMFSSNEKRRFSAFQTGKFWYNSVHPSRSLSSCQRGILYNATVSIAAQALKAEMCILIFRTTVTAFFAICDAATLPTQIRDTESLRVDALVCQECFDESLWTEMYDLIGSDATKKPESIPYLVLFQNPIIRILLFKLL